MQAQTRFVRETAVFNSMLPKLLESHRGGYFVAWDGEVKAICKTLDDAIEILDQQSEDTGVFVAEITEEPVTLPLYFIAA